MQPEQKTPEHVHHRCIYLNHKDAPHAAKHADPSHELKDEVPVKDAAAVRKENEQFCSNYISTTKYNVLTFLPKNLMEQFQKKANFYFLIVAIISLTPLSPKTPFVSVAPLVFVLLVSAIKEAVEDWNRYKMDRSINGSSIKVWRNGRFEVLTWKDVVVGDLVHIAADNAFPADIVVLKSSAPIGSCNIQTANLDGETNLKVKQAVPETYRIQCADDGLDYPLSLPNAVIQSSQPNRKLDGSSWKGNILLHGAKEKVALSMDQLLLRGCMLRNTRWVVGFVVFTGEETKIMLNSKKASFKRSNVDRTVDRALYVLFSLQFCLCSMGAILNYVWMYNNASKAWYLPWTYDSASQQDEAGLSWFTYLVLLDILIPISLYVSMELVKFTQAYLISTDIDMYYAKYDCPAQARTSNLNEELGQVEYIFSDKTGTLTGNIMNFLCCSVDGVAYGLSSLGEGAAASLDNAARGNGAGGAGSAGSAAFALPLCKDMPPYDEEFPFKDPALVQQLLTNPNASRQIDSFLTLLSVCHTVVPDYLCDQEHIHCFPDCKFLPDYQAASPDEKALVVAAKNCQYYFYHREPKTIQIGNTTVNGELVFINILGTHYQFEILDVFAFTSSRARMSVLVRDPRDGKIRVYTKGADTKMVPMLTPESKSRSWNETDQHLTSFARLGLRTLVCGQKVITPDEFEAWFAQHKIAKSSVNDRERLVSESQARMECHLELVGATAIEDRLQDGVPQTIAKLMRANIKVWVLTGDKVETAINIGRSCQLITPQMDAKKLIRIVVKDKMSDAEARQQTIAILRESFERVKDEPEGSDDLGVVVSGRALSFVFAQPTKDPKTGRIIPLTAEEQRLGEELRALFLQVCIKCKAVLCCRVSPNQKAEVVQLVKAKLPDKVTLAIGDGANDVSMIKSAHVGIGISGLEGLQAVMASDYSIAQFRFLANLLLVHGAWSYRRISLLILYSFYKNVAISMTQIWFAIFSGWSAQMYYDPYAGSIYNIIFTSIPVMLAAVFNKEVSKRSSLQYPELYVVGQRREHFNIPMLLANILEGVVVSIGVFAVSAYYYTDVASVDGRSNDVWVCSTAMYTFLVILVNMKIGLLTTTWNWATHLFLYLSVLVWFLFVYVYSALDITPDMYHVAHQLFSYPDYWLWSLLVPIALMIPVVSYKYYKRMYYPTLLDIVAERDAGQISHQIKDSEFDGHRISISNFSSNEDDDVHPFHKGSGSGSTASGSSAAGGLKGGNKKYDEYKSEQEMVALTVTEHSIEPSAASTPQ